MITYQEFKDEVYDGLRYIEETPGVRWRKRSWGGMDGNHGWCGCLMGTVAFRQLLDADTYNYESPIGTLLEQHYESVNNKLRTMFEEDDYVRWDNLLSFNDSAADVGHLREKVDEWFARIETQMEVTGISW